MSESDFSNNYQVLVTTKILMPAIPEPLVVRPRLSEVLNAALSRSRLILVSAQAGSGKTTAVLEWLHQADPTLVGKVAWLSLDERDNETIHFWSYVCRSVENALSELGNSLSSEFYAPQSPNLEKIIADLVNSVVNLSQTLTLVLDDYHLITSPEIHDSMTFLLDRLPSRMHVVMTSRVDPPLPLPRLRLRRQLTELRPADLRFNQAEAGAFLNAVSGQTLTDRNVADLETKTEGWGAALQLAGLLMQNRRDIAAFINNFSGGQRFLLDYLAEEVLRMQTPIVQNFLLQTSVLEQLTASLVEEITGCDDGQAILQNLLKANLFLVPLDDEQHWYRYHHLFRQYLQSRLEQTQPEHVPMLHNWAAHWYEEHNLPFEAIEHALKAESPLYAATLIDQNTQPMYQRHELQTLWRWLQALPPAVLEQHPHHGLNCAWTLVLQNRYEAAVPYTQIVQEALAKPDIIAQLSALEVQACRGEINAVMAFVERNRGHFLPSIALSSEALDLIAPHQSFLRCAIVMNQAYCYVATDNLSAAIERFVQVEALARQSGDKYFMLVSIVTQAGLQAQQGQLRTAEVTCQRAIAAGEADKLPVLGLAYTVLGNLYYERNALEKSEQHYNQAVLLLRPSGDLNLVAVHLGLARLWQTQSQPERAWRELEQAEQLLFNSDQPLWWHQLEQSQVRLRLAQAELTSVQSWADQHQPAKPLPQYLREIDSLLLARLNLTLGQPAEVVPLTQQVTETAVRAGRLTVQVEALLLEALALALQSQLPAALSLLERALRLAQPENFVRVFANEGSALHHLLQTLAQSKPDATLHTYLAKLLAVTGETSVGPVLSALETPVVIGFNPVPSRAAHPLTPLIEPLTEREQEVLLLLATTALDSTAIAEKLSIAVSTLRTHIKNIYAKLEVQSRLQAVSRARELSLISE